MQQASYLFLNVLMPIFLQVFAGFLLQKRFPTEIGSLSKVQFYVFIPAIAFTSLYTTTLGGSLLLAIIASCVLVALILFGISWLVVRGARLNMDKRHALYNAVTIYNSAAATTTKKVIDTFTPVAGTNYFFPGDGIWCDDGIYVVIANTVTLSVIYE